MEIYIFGKSNYPIMELIKEITPEVLLAWLQSGKAVSILDIRPIAERAEWFIPGSIHFNAYDQLKTNDEGAFRGLHLDKTIPVVSVCGGGKTSLVAAGLLQSQGLESYSLQGGVKGRRPYTSNSKP